jgi:hypothetical protein
VDAAQELHQELPTDIDIEDQTSSSIIVINSIIDDLQENQASEEFDCMDAALSDLCSRMGIDNQTLPQNWNIWKTTGSKYIQLTDCVYASKHFAKGNATCHFAWDPACREPRCIKLIAMNQSHEVDILQKLACFPSSKHLVRFYGSEVRGPFNCLKFELVPHIHNFNKDLDRIKQHQIVTYMLALLEALKHLHQDCRIIHGDVKPSNFVHDFGSNTFRLIDFGSAIEHRNKQITSLRGGTNGFKAPEILLHNDKEFRFGPAVDVWSAGIIMMSLLSGNENILEPCNRAAQSCNNVHLSEIGTIGLGFRVSG